MSKELYRHIRDCLARGQRLVLATVVARSGSGPREAGASMAVMDGGKGLGTVGGGLLEAQVMTAAREVLHSACPVCLNFSLNAKEVAAGGMLCGGRVEVLVDVLEGKNPVMLPLFEKIVAAQEERHSVWLIRSIRPEESQEVLVHMKIPPSPLYQRGSRGDFRALMSTPSGMDVSSAGEHTKSHAGLESAADMSLPVVRSAVCTGLGLMDEGDLDAGSLDMAAMTVDMLNDERRRTEATLIVREGIRYFLQPLVLPGRVIIAGAGHVAKELAELCNFLGLRAVVMDDRREFAGRDRFPAADEIMIARDGFQDCFLGMGVDGDCSIVIVTRGHEQDRNVLVQALRTDAGYIGMIGSRRKRDAIYRSLAGEGVSPDDLARVHCPIGVAIGARTPAEIAVSIGAELIAFRAGKLCLNNK